VLKVMALGQAVVAADLRDPPYPELARVTQLLHTVDACTVELVTVRPQAAAASGAMAPARAADPAGLEGLKALGVTMLALANSSSIDVNGGGLGDLVAAARARDLTFAGAGTDLAAANAAGYRTVPAGKVALIAAASGDPRPGVAAGDSRPGINVIPRLPNGQLEPLEIERVASQVHAAAENADVAVLYLQHEAEREGRPSIEWMQRVARRAIESGAGLVVGAGLPQLQGIEVYRNRPIFYGLGNVLLQVPGEVEPEALQALAARCTFAGDTLRQIDLIPLQLTAAAADDPRSATRGRPILAEGQAGAAILARVAELSRPHNTNVAVADGVGRIAL
jgi:poly-gamma-glutamate capsule biosynthesis protein CapA/YwtB (metallophosphatase superfamily)